MSEPAWYAAWRHDAVHQLMAKNDVLEQRFALGSYERYDYDVDTCALVFSHGGGPRVRAQIQLIGSTASSKDEWLWAWANDWWPKVCVQAAEATRRYGDENGIEQLTTEYLYSDALVALGWEVTAVAARVTGALGAYRPPTDNGHLFFVYTAIDFVS